MAWWLEGVTFRHFKWVKNFSKAFFKDFWSQKTKEKIKIFEELSEILFPTNIGGMII